MYLFCLTNTYLYRNKNIARLAEGPRGREFRKINGKQKQRICSAVLMVEVTRLELTTSWSRTASKQKRGFAAARMPLCFLRFVSPYPANIFQIFAGALNKDIARLAEGPRGRESRKIYGKQKQRICSAVLMVEVTRLELTTSWSRTKRATNCATPRDSLIHYI